jgi:predicted nucleic-acid-binding protein
MIGLDTNVVIRMLTADDGPQLGVIKRLLAAHAKESDAFYLNHVVLAECAWVLKSAYELDRDQIATGLESLLETAAIAVESPLVVEAAIKSFRTSKADFSDCLVSSKNSAAGCDHTVTFDRAMRELPAVKVL